MKPSTVLPALGLVVVVVLAAACTSARRSEPIIGYSTANHSVTFAEGRRVFVRNCHTCHPGGEGGLGPALNNKPLPATLIKFQVRHGLGTMPAFKPEQISPDELTALVAYLVALRRAD